MAKKPAAKKSQASEHMMPEKAREMGMPEKMGPGMMPGMMAGKKPVLKKGQKPAHRM